MIQKRDRRNGKDKFQSKNLPSHFTFQPHSWPLLPGLFSTSHIGVCLERHIVKPDTSIRKWYIRKSPYNKRQLCLVPAPQVRARPVSYSCSETRWCADLWKSSCPSPSPTCPANSGARCPMQRALCNQCFDYQDHLAEAKRPCFPDRTLSYLTYHLYQTSYLLIRKVKNH